MNINFKHLTLNMFTLITLNVCFLDSFVLASPRYQERDEIYGEIKFAEFCNVSNSLRARVIAEAGSRNSRVSKVQFKIYSRYAYGVKAWGEALGYVTSESWRPIGVPDYRNNVQRSQGDRRFYDTQPMTFPLTSVVDSPIKFSIHVQHSKGKTIDLGGIVDMGKIEVGKCKVYDDGNFR